VYVDQPDTGNGLVTLSVPVKLTLKSGANSLTFGSGQSSEWARLSVLHGGLAELTRFLVRNADYAGDLDKIVVYTAT
jgi:hypothetical protein